jgi:hypothetical protein
MDDLANNNGNILHTLPYSGHGHIPTCSPSWRCSAPFTERCATTLRTRDGKKGHPDPQQGHAALVALRTLAHLGYFPMMMSTPSAPRLDFGFHSENRFKVPGVTVHGSLATA